MSDSPPSFPGIRPLGLSGLLVSFGDSLSDPANRAALAFRAAIEAQGWPDLRESAPSLASVHLEFDPLHEGFATASARVRALLATQDWFAAPLPADRRLWTIPAVIGGPLAPQFEETAALAGQRPEALRQMLITTPVRVLTLGFAPGQPYLGHLPELWDIPRQTGLTPVVPEGAIVLAIRQLVLFAASTPTGWRHVAQSAFRCFRPEQEDPFPLRPGDELRFTPVSEDDLAAIRNADTSGNGGAVMEVLP